MLSKDFTVWLSGFLDAAGASLTTEQVSIIRDKLASVDDMNEKQRDEIAPVRRGDVSRPAPMRLSPRDKYGLPTLIC